MNIILEYNGKQEKIMLENKPAKEIVAYCMELQAKYDDFKVVKNIADRFRY